MPYICLARTDIPDGTLQVLDLLPNTSQRSDLDPPGQTRYVNRAQDDTVQYDAGVLVNATRGLSAYLADRVDPGGTQLAASTAQTTSALIGDTLVVGGVTLTAVENNASGTITVGDPTAAVGRLTVGLTALDCVEDAATGVGATPNTVLAADAITIAGVLFTAQNGGGPDPALQQFDMSGTDQACSDSLVTAINDGVSQGLLTAALDALVAAPTSGLLPATNAGGAAVAITLTPSVLGVWGDAVIIQTVGGATLTPVSLTHTDPVAANQEFGSAAHYEGVADPSDSVATSIAATINDGATQTLILADYAGPPPASLDGSMTAAAVADVVTCTATLPGWSGQLDLATTEGGQLVLSTATLFLVIPVAANQEFGSLLQTSTDVLAAATVAVTLNNAATDALLVAAGGSAVTAVDGGTDTVAITADVAGSTGAMTLAETGGTFTLGADHLVRAHETWTLAQIVLNGPAVQALVDAGAAVTLAGLNAAINGVAGVSGVSLISVGSSATVLDVLEILAGREYRVPLGSVKAPAARLYQWDTTAGGSFTHGILVQDTNFDDGEWHPTTIGGDTVQYENKGVRDTLHSQSFAISLASGSLSRLADTVNTLFPDSDISPWYPTTFQKGPNTAQVNNVRLVTVYDDDGSVLA